MNHPENAPSVEALAWRNRGARLAPSPSPELVAAIQALPEAHHALDKRAQVVRDLPRSKFAQQMARIETDPNFTAAIRAECWAFFTTCFDNEGLAASTVERYAINLRAWFTYATERGYDHATASLQQLNAWQQCEAIQRSRAIITRCNQIAAIRRFYQWRYDAGIGDNCAQKLKAPKRVDSRRRAMPLPDQQRMFAACASIKDPIIAKRDRVMLLLLLATGARHEELQKLNTRDLMLNVNTGTVRLQGKGGKVRSVSIEGPVVRELQEWLVMREDVPPLDDALFVSTRRRLGRCGDRLSKSRVYGTLRRLAEQAKVKFDGIHTFRATYATTMYETGMDLSEIQRCMGHADPKTTMGYIEMTRRQKLARIPSEHQRQLLGQNERKLPAWFTQNQGASHD